MDYENTSTFDSFGLQVTSEAQKFLKTAAGWAMFLSIVGFIIILFSLLASFGIMAAGTALQNTPGMAMFSGMTMGLSMLVLTALMFLPVLYLFKFSISTNQALSQSNTEGITKALANLRGYFMWAGILTIIWIIAYVVFVAMAVSSAASLSGM